MDKSSTETKQLPSIPATNELIQEHTQSTPDPQAGSSTDQNKGSLTDPQWTSNTSSLGEFKFFKPLSTTSSKPNQDTLPEGFFEPTSADLKAAQAQLVARVKAYQDAPLLTEKLRNEREKEVRDRYPTTTLRIKFADRSVLEKTFPSSSKIKPVYAFVRGCLREDAKAHKFVLFESPPRRDLRVSDVTVKDKSLYDLHLAPQSILHFRFLEESVKLDLPSGPPPLLPEILRDAEELPLPPSLDAPPTPAKSNQAETSSKSTASPRNIDESKAEKLSRLLKLGSKHKK